MLRKTLHAGIIGVLFSGLLGSLMTVSGQQQDNPYTTGQDVQTGEQLFGRNCSRCHGLEAGGGERGPNLTTGEFQHASTDASLFTVISASQIPRWSGSGKTEVTSLSGSSWPICAH